MACVILTEELAKDRANWRWPPGIGTEAGLDARLTRGQCAFSRHTNAVGEKIDSFSRHSLAQTSDLFL